MPYLLLIILWNISSWICFDQSGNNLNMSNPHQTFVWPEGKQAALSLSFDDARGSQMDVGLQLFREYNAKVTFYVLPSALEPKLDQWKSAVADGHEIGNHSLYHPCTGNFLWSRDRALEDYTIDRMREELKNANSQIKEILGVAPVSFAYPCGQTFVGRGTGTGSYVPVAAQLFTSARGWLDESPNDPSYCDMAQITGMSMDAMDFEQLLPLLEQTQEHGQWLVLAGHEIGDKGAQTTRKSMLRQLIHYAQDPNHGIWLAPVGTVAAYAENNRE